MRSALTCGVLGVISVYGAAPMAQAALMDGLQIYYDMDNANSGGIPDSAGATADNGILHNPGSNIVTTGKFGNGLILTSNTAPSGNSGTYVEVPRDGDFSSITSAVSVSLWVNITSDSKPTSNSSFFDGTPDALSIYGTAGTAGGTSTLYWKVTSAATGNPSLRVTQSVSSLVGAGWVNLIGTFDGHTSTFYVNGAPVTGTVSGADYTQLANSGTYYPYINADNASNSLINGSIDDVGVWNRALTPAEAAFIYNNGVGNPISASTAPEPASLSLAAAAGGLLLARRRRAR